MKGCQITFYTQQGREHAGLQVGEWLVREARKLGLRGATMIKGEEGLGHDHRLHSAFLFEMDSDPIVVMMALSEEEASRLLARLHEEKLDVFYVKLPIEFGGSGSAV